MWGEMERSPALAAPGSNDFTGLIANSTAHTIGSEAEKFQALPDDQANNLCKRYRPLALKIAAAYVGRGIEDDDLRNAGQLGLVKASRKYDPARGAFGPYAKFWIKGEITTLFKRIKADEPTVSLGAIDESTAAPVDPPKADLAGLSPREGDIVDARRAGETLRAIGLELGLSAERVRQIEARATNKLRTGKGKVARACIRDLIKRRGYLKPYWDSLALENSRLKRTRYEGRCFSPDEVAAFVACRPEIFQSSAEDRATWLWWSDQRLWWAERDAGVSR
jgi:hypothetical protein